MDTVRLGGKKRPIHFGFNTLRLFCSKTGRTLETLGAEMSFDETITLIMTGLEDGGRLAKEQIDIETELLCDWLDASPGSYNECIRLYLDALPLMFPPAIAPQTRGEA